MACDGEGFEVDVTIRLGDKPLAVRFSTGPGLTALHGPSGAGKTSVLDAIAGLRRPERGRIAVAGRPLFDHAAGIDMPVEGRRTGYVFQDARLFPHRRVRDNLTYAVRGGGGGGALATFDETVALLDIGHLLDRWPRRLSGGEAKRVAIGRALLSAPRYLLLDEPLSSLDAARRGEVMAAIARIRDRLSLPILYVTHDQAELDRLATHRVDLRQATIA